MTRKLFSLLISSFALILLMGAGVEQEPAVLVEDDQVQAAQTADLQEEAEPVPAVAGESALTLAQSLDYTLTVDGQPVTTDVAKTYRNETTYVALAPMSKCMDSTIAYWWDGATQTMTVTSGKLTLTAKLGDLYLVANGRYLYAPEGIYMADNKVMVPLSALTKAFGATLSWDGATGLTSVKRGSGGIVSGDQYYNQEDLYWISRVIYTESGNQPLEGMMAVGNVILNRVNHPSFPKTIEGVLAQKNQFTTYHTGHIQNSTPNARSVVAAKLVLDGGVVEETRNALYFDSTSNSWAARNRTCIAVIGGHRFYA